MNIPRIFFFLCDLKTEPECLNRQLVGTTATNFEWATRITPGDYIFLYNFQTGDVFGPFLASTIADCYDQQAWGGRFPVQVRVARTTGTRRGNLLAWKQNSLLGQKGTRPPHVLEGDLVITLLKWISQYGTDF